MAKTVWILGSGFSKSLGGPLLYELFSARAAVELPAFYQAIEVQIGQACGAYEKGKKLGMWQDAEQFLEVLGSAVGEPPNHSRRGTLRSVTGNDDIDGLYLAAKQTIAAQCHFTRDADLSDERWQPYLKWAQELDGDHAIITFNYDLVLEALSPEVQTLGVPVLGRGKAQSRSQARIYKMHGSIDWVERDNGAIVRMNTPKEAFLDGSQDVVIAAPGRAKRKRVQGALDGIWERAMDELHEADTVIFLGYRFPPSDSDSRARLLGALGGLEPVKSRHVMVNLVLGPDTASPDSRRLSAMLRHTLRTKGYSPPGAYTPRANYHVTPVPLYAEDFLSVVPVGHLRQMYKVEAS